MIDGTITDETLDALAAQVQEVLAAAAAAIETEDDDAVGDIFQAIASAHNNEPDGTLLFALSLLEQSAHLLVDLVAAEKRIAEELDTGTDPV